MRSLFVKTLLMFALANGLVAGLLFIVAVSLRLDPGAHVMGSVLEGHAAALTALVDAGQLEAARALTDRLRSEAGVDAYLLDAAGHDVLGRDPPAALRDVIDRDAAGHADGPVGPPTGAGGLPGLRARRLPPDEKGRTLLATLPLFPPAQWVGRAEFVLPRVVIGVATTALVCYLFAAYLVAPVRRLQLAARSIATGNYGARAGDAVGRRRDEIGALAQDFDRMATHVEQLIGEQRRLFHHISHELRSPLARLQVACGLLRRGCADPLLDRIERESERINAQIDQLLQLARLESAGQPRRVERVDLTRVSSEIAHDADFEARARGSRVTAELAPAIMLRGDEDILRSALENLVRNAVRHTADNTTVTLELRREPAEAVVTIRDHGPGITPEELERMTEPFMRTQPGRIGGLGLAIARRGVALHEGSIEFSNYREGGLIVVVRLPCDVLGPRPADDLVRG